MKNKNDSEKRNKHDSKCTCKSKVWKIVAVSVILIFAVLIAGGLIKAHYIRASFEKPTQSQIDYATQIASDKLESSGENPASFQLNVASMMRHHKDDINRTVIQVSFYNETVTHSYLVDINSGEVISHMENEIFVPLGNTVCGNHSFGPGFGPMMGIQRPEDCRKG